MENRERKSMFIGSIGIFTSLNKAISEAGGVPFELEDLNNITALGLLAFLSTNNIRFYFDKDAHKPKEKN